MTNYQEACGDTCSVVASMASTFKEYVPKEQRMAEAIKAVQSGKMSQRAAATKFDVAQRTLSHRLEKVSHLAHPTKPVAAEGKSGDRGSVAKALRALAKSIGITHTNGIPIGKAGVGQIYAAITEAGHDVPEDITPASRKKNKSQPINDNRKQQPTGIQPDNDKEETAGLPANDSLPVIPDREAEADSEPEHPAFSDHLDIDAVRQHVNEQVQQSDRPADFKRAIELLTELDIICTNAWYRRQPEPWGHDDWAHVSSEIEALHSIVGQRAEETADELLRKSTAFEVESTAVC